MKQAAETEETTNRNEADAMKLNSPVNDLEHPPLNKRWTPGVRTEREQKYSVC